jgi:hypothetical protein
MTLSKAWGVDDKWLEDPRVKFSPEPRNLDAAFRKMTEPFAGQPATKAVGDCFLLAYAKEVPATSRRATPLRSSRHRFTSIVQGS